MGNTQNKDYDKKFEDISVKKELIYNYNKHFHDLISQSIDNENNLSNKIKIGIDNILKNDNLDDDLKNLFFSDCLQKICEVYNNNNFLNEFIDNYGKYIILNENLLNYLCCYINDDMLDIIERLYNNNIDINTYMHTYTYNYNIIMNSLPIYTASFIIVSKAGKFNILKFLIDKNKNKIKIDMRDSIGNTALYYACENNHIEIIELLLSINANISIKNCKFLNPLLITIINNNNHNNNNIIDMLLNNYKSKKWSIEDDPINYALEYIELYNLNIDEETKIKLKGIDSKTKSALKLR